MENPQQFDKLEIITIYADELKEKGDSTFLFAKRVGKTQCRGQERVGKKFKRFGLDSWDLRGDKLLK